METKVKNSKKGSAKAKESPSQRQQKKNSVKLNIDAAITAVAKYGRKTA